MTSVQGVGFRKGDLLPKAAPILLIAIFLASHVSWVLTDQRVWAWDQANYGALTLQLWNARLLGASAWLQAMAHATSSNPPLLVWAGQFLVPFGDLTGNIESMLLFVNIAAAGGTLTLVYLISRSLGAGSTAALAAVLTCAGSPIFIFLTNQYLHEAVQCCAAASMVFVAWRAEQRSLVRTFSLLLIATAFSFLTKTSSGTFVLPLLTYVVVSLIIMRARPKPTVRLADVVLLFAAIMITGAALVWYAVNWKSLVNHFVNATSSDFTLYWGSPVHFPTKIVFWTKSLATALSPFYFLAICLGILITVALTIAILRSYHTRFSAWAESLVEIGGLFALALTGTVIATMCAFSLQINEDYRFLIPLIPLISVLVAWSLAIVQHRAIVASVLVLLIVNAVVTQAYAHGANLFYLAPLDWMYSQVQPDPQNKLLLTAAIRTSCPPDAPKPPSFVAIDYPHLNVNSANFYSEKQRKLTGLRCQYTNYLWYDTTFQTDVQHALGLISRAAPTYVLTVAPDKQVPADRFNVVTRPVAENLAYDPDYELVSDPRDYILIYKRIRATK